MSNRPAFKATIDEGIMVSVYGCCYYALERWACSTQGDWTRAAGLMPIIKNNPAVRRALRKLAAEFITREKGSCKSTARHTGRQTAVSVHRTIFETIRPVLRAG